MAKFLEKAWFIGILGCLMLTGCSAGEKSSGNALTGAWTDTNRKIPDLVLSPDGEIDWYDSYDQWKLENDGTLTIFDSTGWVDPAHYSLASSSDEVGHLTGTYFYDAKSDTLYLESGVYKHREDQE